MKVAKEAKRAGVARIGLVRASDQVESNTANQLRDKVRTSTQAGHIDADTSSSSVRKRAVKSGRGGAKTADSRKTAFHKRWLEGASPSTVEEFGWARDFNKPS